LKILGIDLGKSRTGLAVSDLNNKMAFPFKIIKEKNKSKLLEKISEIIKTENIELVIIGLPKNMNNTEGESANNSREFSEKLSSKNNIKVILQDERCTTISANNYLNLVNFSKNRKEIIDTVAATIILQDFLDFKNNN